MVNDTPGFPPVEGPIDDVTIPFLGARLEDAGAVAALDGEAATLTAVGPVPNPRFGYPAGFTSAGPVAASSALKPDVSAPGVGIASAAAGTGTAARIESGTSMASPFVAGVAALVRQAHPDWDAQAVHAAVVNTGDPTAVEDHTTLRAGSGLVRALEAATTTVVATADPLAATLSYGFLEDPAAIDASRPITVWNRGDTTATFTIGVESGTDAGGAGAVMVPAGTVVVQPDGARTVDVRLVVDATQVPQGLQTVSGNVVLTPTDGQAGTPTLRVPYAAVVRGVSALATTPATVQLPPGAESVFFTTTNAAAVAGRLDVFAWQLSDPTDEPASADIRAAGIQLLDAGGTGSPTAAFAINLDEPVTTPVRELWQVLIDVDGDGSGDYAVLGIDLGVLAEGTLTGELGSLTIDLDTFRIVRAFGYRDPVLNTSTIVLPFVYADLGITEARDPDFDYAVATVSLFDQRADIATGIASFDPFHPPVETAQSLAVPPGGRVQWNAAVDRSQLAAHPALGWLVAYPTNLTGPPSADLIPLIPTG
jgi:hypothetical protein